MNKQMIPFSLWQVEEEAELMSEIFDVIGLCALQNLAYFDMSPISARAVDLASSLPDYLFDLHLAHWVKKQVGRGRVPLNIVSYLSSVHGKCE